MSEKVERPARKVWDAARRRYHTERDAKLAKPGRESAAAAELAKTAYAKAVVATQKRRDKAIAEIEKG